MTDRNRQVALHGADLRVMIVEKHALTGMVLANMIESLGHEVVGYTARPTKALQLASTAWLDVAILALDSPESIFPVADMLAMRNIPFAFSAPYDYPVVENSIYADRPMLRRPFQEADLAMTLWQLTEPEEAIATGKHQRRA
jgi:DNA-binding NarL/FixJ family response regulator